MKPAVVVLSSGAGDVARTIAGVTGGSVHGLRRRIEGCEVAFDDAGVHLRTLFVEGRPIVAVMAAGAVIRLLADALADKCAEPPVIAVSEDGKSIVPLLGGHHGANRLASQIAEALGGHAAITTAGDVRFGIALDEPPAGYRLANPEGAKNAMAALLGGACARLEGGTISDVGDAGDRRGATWLLNSRIPFAPEGSVQILFSARQVAADGLCLHYVPQVLSLGVGCERGAGPAEVIALAETALAGKGLSPLALAGVFSLDRKADEAAVHAVAAHFGVPARFFDALTLEAETPRLVHPSEAVFAEVGCHGVAEGAALASVGPDGALVVPKVKSRRATVAIAHAPRPIEAEAVGRARGRLFVTGIGPGAQGWRSPEVTQMIGEASDLIGYSLYLDLLGPLARGKVRHDFDLGAEEARVRRAMELASEGRTVALVCSGDAGIYAMATLVFELLDKGDLPDAARRIEIVLSPGISALQAAAARAGAPLGHDFCTISLSDLLTPWEVIKARVKAAAEADFVIAFYNPVSRKRRTQLTFARDVLLEHRSADCPVILATNLGRERERVRVVSLAELDVEEVDMLTVVVVGSSETRVVKAGDGRTWVYTPRGYAGKAGSAIKNLRDAAE